MLRLHATVALTQLCLCLKTHPGCNRQILDGLTAEVCVAHREMDQCMFVNFCELCITERHHAASQPASLHIKRLFWGTGFQAREPGGCKCLLPKNFNCNLDLNDQLTRSKVVKVCLCIGSPRHTGKQQLPKDTRRLSGEEAPMKTSKARTGIAQQAGALLSGLDPRKQE